MTTGIFITARLGSTRLQRKHLLEVAGKPLLQYLLDRAAHEFSKEIGKGEVEVVIVTSDLPENREFEKLCRPGVQVFYGSDSNIPLRHLQGARARGVANIVAVDGDDILCSVAAMREVYQSLAGGALYAKTSGLPFGMNCFGYQTGFLEQGVNGHQGETLETGWGRIFDEARLAVLPMDLGGNGLPLRFSLDYQEDYQFFDRVISTIGAGITEAADREIVSVAVDNNFYSINADIAEAYQRNFNQAIEMEARGNESK
ncbi:hypothetical protein KP005_11295 [Geomonas nitrogeniifigens]|uniref:Spore coat polysaccharide biosynthesis protein SpsF n=1 Tax=Geomonas diazotrophica TaxID=2843197 RepID=A0ABX8JKH7_9BACT|nr:hypothetical protein [Geomonas nitrogeniifigens]QWV95970.1 hypothetical protein KP005_11295 [Geomonas nitrogeniifigens]